MKYNICKESIASMEKVKENKGYPPREGRGQVIYGSQLGSKVQVFYSGLLRAENTLLRLGRVSLTVVESSLRDSRDDLRFLVISGQASNFLMILSQHLRNILGISCSDIKEIWFDLPSHNQN